MKLNPEKFIKKKRSLKWFRERINTIIWNTSLQSSLYIIDIEMAVRLYGQQDKFKYSAYNPNNL